MGYSEFIILKVINNYNKIFISVFLEKKTEIYRKILRVLSQRLKTIG